MGVTQGLETGGQKWKKAINLVIIIPEKKRLFTVL